MTEEKEESTDRKEKFIASVSAYAQEEPSRLMGLLGVDVDAILRPISEDRPAGDYLLYEGTYDRIREARREDDVSLPLGVWERDLKKADWESVKELCVESLKNRTKDLQIAAWMLEAFLHLYGYAGIEEGLRIVLLLSRTFWDQLYPSIEEQDLEARISPFVWINEKLSLKLKMEPVTAPQSVDGNIYSFVDWENANTLEKLAARDKKAYEEAEKTNKVTRTKFLASVMFSSGSFYAGRYRELSGALENLRALDRFLKEKCGNLGPSLGNFQSVLEEIQALVWSFLKEKKPEAGEAMENGVPEPSTGSRTQAGDYPEGDPVKSLALSIRSRAEAYRMLSGAADYLFIHEPHSPTPYLVKRAVSWGNMTLMELLQELIDNENDLQFIFNLLGIKR